MKDSAEAPLNVRMGEMLVTSQGRPLKTLLGSCVGLVLYSRRRQSEIGASNVGSTQKLGQAGPAIGGLAHIVLPEARGRDGSAAKFADVAIPALAAQIESAGGGRRLRAKIAGGANMFDSAAESTIGDQNLTAIRALLRELLIPIVAEHCGGTQGRKLTFYPRTATVTIEVVGGENIEI